MSLIFDGHDFSTLFIWGEPAISILNAQPDTRDVSGRNGAAFVGMKYGVSTVSFSLAVLGDAESRRVALSTLGEWLMVDEPKPLYLPDTPDRYYLAVPNGVLDMTRGIGGELTKVTFTLTDPVAYGDSKTIALASGGTVTINVNGTAPTYLDVSSTAAVRDGSALVWGVRVDDLDFVHVATGSSSARSVVIDGTNRVCKVQGALTMPTLDSDWLMLEPGTHEITMDYGTGAATLDWVERWY